MGAEVKTMDIKKAQQASAAEGELTSRKVQNFVADLKSEIHQVHWTSRDELISYAKIVVIATFTFGMAIYFMDLLTQTALNGLSYIIHLIGG